MGVTKKQGNGEVESPPQERPERIWDVNFALLRLVEGMMAASYPLGLSLGDDGGDDGSQTRNGSQIRGGMRREASFRSCSYSSHTHPRKPWGRQACEERIDDVFMMPVSSIVSWTLATLSVANAPFTPARGMSQGRASSSFELVDIMTTNGPTGTRSSNANGNGNGHGCVDESGNIASPRDGVGDGMPWACYRR